MIDSAPVEFQIAISFSHEEVCVIVYPILFVLLIDHVVARHTCACCGRAGGLRPVYTSGGLDHQGRASVWLPGYTANPEAAETTCGGFGRSRPTSWLG
jgi:hypothetical protein